MKSVQPRGRPKGALNDKTIILSLAKQKVPWTDAAGKQVTITRAQWVAKLLMSLVAAGDARAFDLANQLGTVEDQSQDTGHLVVPELLTEQEWEAKMAEASNEYAKIEHELKTGKPSRSLADAIIAAHRKISNL